MRVLGDRRLYPALERETSVETREVDVFDRYVGSNRDVLPPTTVLPARGRLYNQIALRIGGLEVMIEAHDVGAKPGLGCAYFDFELVPLLDTQLVRVSHDVSMLIVISLHVV
jgi:hypothetical protein